MSAGYALSRSAEDDLHEILVYVADESGSNRALHVHSSFVAAFELLAEIPGSGSRRVEITGDQLRWWRVFNWLVLYDPESSPVMILRVVHGARALDRILGRGE